METTLGVGTDLVEETPVASPSTADFVEVNDVPVANEPPVDQSKAVVMGAGEMTTAPEEVGVDDLPAGWVMATDPTSGRMSYFNSETGETSWECPAPPSKSDAEITEGKIDEQQPLEDAQTENVDSTEGISGDASSTSGEDATVEDSHSVTAPSEDMAAGEISAPGTDSDTSPAGWVEVINPAHGRPYFYNAETGETSSERPPPQLQVGSQEVEVEGEPGTESAENGIGRERNRPRTLYL